MTTKGFTVTHARDADFERGLRSFFEYRDLGIREATEGKVVAHVIRAAGGGFQPSRMRMRMARASSWSTFSRAG